MNQEVKSTLKVSKATIERLRRVAGRTMMDAGKKASLEDVIIMFLDEYEAKACNGIDKAEKMQKDREAFLAMIDCTFPGLAPEDSSEYDYEDIGG